MAVYTANTETDIADTETDLDTETDIADTEMFG